MTIYEIYDHGKKYKFVVKTALELWNFNKKFKKDHFKK